jgi:hypothetical protein
MGQETRPPFSVGGSPEQLGRQFSPEANRLLLELWFFWRRGRFVSSGLATKLVVSSCSGGSVVTNLWLP